MPEAKKVESRGQKSGHLDLARVRDETLVRTPNRPIRAKEETSVSPRLAPIQKARVTVL